jgi:hypothetical protein
MPAPTALAVPQKHGTGLLGFWHAHQKKGAVAALPDLINHTAAAAPPEETGGSHWCCCGCVGLLGCFEETFQHRVRKHLYLRLILAGLFVLVVTCLATLPQVVCCILYFLPLPPVCMLRLSVVWCVYTTHPPRLFFAHPPRLFFARDHLCDYVLYGVFMCACELTVAIAILARKLHHVVFHRSHHVFLSHRSSPRQIRGAKHTIFAPTGLLRWSSSLLRKMVLMRGR